MNGMLRDIREVIREEMMMRPKIIQVLQSGPQTVPEIAEVLGYPTQEVMFWVMGLRKYGHISEIPEANDEGYFQYRIAENSGSETEGD